MKAGSEKLSILLIGTAGVEIRQVAPPRPYSVGYVHETHAWSRLECSCGEVHEPCAPAVLSVIVGPPQPNVHVDPGACGVAISPESQRWSAASLSEVLGPVRDFNLWAAHAVRHMIAGVSEPGLIGFDLQDVVDVLTPARTLRFARQSAAGGLVSAAAELVASNGWLSLDVASATIGLWGDDGTTLAEISAAVEVLQPMLATANLFIYAPIEPGLPAISILGA